MGNTEYGSDLPAGDRESSTSPRERLRGRRILVIEDVRAIADYLADLLRDLGCVVVGPFRDEQQARGAIAEQEFDAAVLDQQVSAQISCGVATTLHQRGIPFLYMTGSPGEFSDPRFPPASILEKPFSPRDFEEALLKLLP